MLVFPRRCIIYGLVSAATSVGASTAIAGTTATGIPAGTAVVPATVAGVRLVPVSVAGAISGVRIIAGAVSGSAITGIAAPREHRRRDSRLVTLR